jgi:hypothetical protein
LFKTVTFTPASAAVINADIGCTITYLDSDNATITTLDKKFYNNTLYPA